VALVKIKLPDDVADYLEQNPRSGRKAIAERLNVSDRIARVYSAIGNILLSADKEHITESELNKCTVDLTIEPGKRGSATVHGYDVKEKFSRKAAIQKAIKEIDVETKEWNVVKTTIKMSDVSMKLRKRTGKLSHQYEDVTTTVTNWHVGIELKPNKLRHYQEAFDKIVANAKPVISTIPPPRVVKPKDLCGVLEPADAHIAKHAWHKETLGGDMDLPISIKKFQYGCESNLHKMSAHKLAQLHIVLGHDIIHIDNRSGMTEKGHNQLDYDSRFVKIIEQTENAVIKIIDQCLQIAPTKIIWVPGNHDFHASFHLCRAMFRRYENFKHVTFDIGPSSRKMINWGDNLIGLVHDAEGRKRVPTVNLMAQYDPWKQYWSKARFSELHTGHLHKRETITIGGTLWRRIAALSTIDAWHADGVFTDAVPCCQSFVYHKKEGVYAEYPTNITYLDGVN
jgi:hypothetical protein